jgi:hypothetical protein
MRTRSANVQCAALVERSAGWQAENVLNGDLWQRLNVERTVYGTVVLMSVLVVYEGWAGLATFLGTAVVIVAPTLAIVAAHYLADVMALHVHLQRPLIRTEWVGLVGHQTGIALSAVPPLVIVLIGWISPLDAVSTIAVLLWTGVVTLMFLSWISARKAGYRGPALAVAAVLGGAVGLVVISMQVLLKPH